jgi:hypothetical protein
MEILLAIVVASAVIFFGALISMGNERQRKAIDNLREQVVLWAVKDLQIKREKLARDVKIDNPLGWFKKMMAKACSLEGDLQIVEVFESPEVIVCTYPELGKTIFLTPLSPDTIRRLVHEKHSRITKLVDGNPLLTIPRNVIVKDVSVLNGGFLFDLELALAWKGLTGQDLFHTDRLWVYELP